MRHQARDSPSPDVHACRGSAPGREGAPRDSPWPVERVGCFPRPAGPVPQAWKHPQLLSEGLRYSDRDLEEGSEFYYFEYPANWELERAFACLKDVIELKPICHQTGSEESEGEESEGQSLALAGIPGRGRDSRSHPLAPRRGRLARF